VAITIFAIMIVLLLLGFRYDPADRRRLRWLLHAVRRFSQLETMVQQMMAGIRPAR
jgi:multisubunit Na+/H+ antiporter MnhB subunit